MMNGIKAQLTEMIDHRKEELVELLRELVKTPSESGQEERIAELIAKKLQGFGFDNVHRDDLHNVYCRVAGDHGGRTFLYNGHIDTVPLGDLSLWPADPREAPIVGDRIIGRGCCDMKGSLAAMMIAADSVRKARVPLKGDLILTMVSREEGGLQEGTRYVMENRGIKADIALVGEATNLEINLACRGRVIIDLTVHGKSAHAANAAGGINAIIKMSKLIDAIRRMKLPEHTFFGPTTQMITRIACLPDVLNMVPNQCSISIDRRISPGDNPEKTKAEFQTLIDQLKADDPEFKAHVETGRSSIPGYLPPEDSTLKTLQESAESILRKRPRLSRYIFGTDGSYISGVAGIPWFGFGPGDEANAHSVNDHVRIEDLVNASKIYALFIIDLLC